MVSPDPVAVVIRSGLTVTVITIKLEQGHSRGAQICQLLHSDLLIGVYRFSVWIIQSVNYSSVLTVRVFAPD